MIETSRNRIGVGKLARAVLIVVLALALLVAMLRGGDKDGFHHMRTATGGDCSAIWVNGEWFCP